MRNKDYLFKNVKKFNNGYISLKKKPLKSSLISYSIKIKNNLSSKIFNNNEISIKEILTNMLSRTNKIYNNLEFNVTNVKLDNDESSKRSKIIKTIKDFISNNIDFKGNNNNFDTILCNVLYFFDILIVQNIKYKLLSTFEKLALGALILVIKFNKLQDKLLIKKYKSVFNDKYMTLEQINKIEILSLQLINYYIIQPNPINYLNFLYTNIFANNKCKNIRNILKMNKSILISIMSFSNNYIQYHPFYLACFIIKYCFEQNKIDGFQKALIDFFDMNMRIFRTNYEEFVKFYNNQMSIKLNFEMPKKEDNKLLFQKKEINNGIIHKIKNLKKYNTRNTIPPYNSFIYKSCKKEIKKNNRNNLLINGTINSMNNTYYKKFLDNYLTDRSNELSENEHQNLKFKKILDVNYLNIKVNDSNEENKKKVNKNNYTIESPKKCGIMINYRIKKKKTNEITNKIISFNLRKICEKNNVIFKIKKNERINNEKIISENKENNDNIQNIKNNEINNKERLIELEFKNCLNRYNYSSIRKNYKRKYLKNLDENKSNVVNKSNNYLLNNSNKILNVKLVNQENRKIEEEKEKEIKINSYFEKYKDFKSFQTSNNKININDSNPKNTINQSESSNSYFKEINKEKKRVHKVHIRNFYKQKNSLLFNLSNFETSKF